MELVPEKFTVEELISRAYNMKYAIHGSMHTSSVALVADLRVANAIASFLTSMSVAEVASINRIELAMRHLDELAAKTKEEN